MTGLPMLAYGMPSAQELLPIILLLLLFFGARKLPELARSLGRSITEFKKGREDGALEEGSGQKPGADHPTDA